MNDLRPELPPLPAKMRYLPVDKRGYPVPFFVDSVDGEPDHRTAKPSAKKRCVEESLCWICGGRLGVFKAFVIGPLGAITRTTSEPPCHLECATYAAKACPHLTRPHARRREAGLPEGRTMPGTPLLENPGVVCVWVTTDQRPFRVRDDQGREGVMFTFGEPEVMYWLCEARQATRSEVDTAIYSRLPALAEQAKRDGEAGLVELAARVAKSKLLLDGAAALK